MSFLAVFLIVVFVVVVALGPIFGAESRPGFQKPNQKAKQNVGPPWHG